MDPPHQRRCDPAVKAMLLGLGISVAVALFAVACAHSRTGGHDRAEGDRQPAPSAPPDPYSDNRLRMVERQIRARGILNPRVLKAMEEVPRHLFVPHEGLGESYEDHPLPIGMGQTISQPYIVAFMTEQARPLETDRALEIGTGSGYQAAILAKLVKEVYTVELLEPLGKSAEGRLKSMGYSNVRFRVGDGWKGWPEHEPFDVILVTAAAEEVPAALVGQLAPNGRMVIPIGTRMGVQDLILLEKDGRGRTSRRNLLPVRFVPLVRSD